MKQAAAAGTIPKRDAKRALGRFDKIRRELKRLMAATAKTTRRGLATLDRDIERIRKEG
jgi:predicted nucleic acid-binding protein